MPKRNNRFQRITKVDRGDWDDHLDCDIRNAIMDDMRRAYERTVNRELRDKDGKENG